MLKQESKLQWEGRVIKIKAVHRATGENGSA